MGHQLQRLVWKVPIYSLLQICEETQQQKWMPPPQKKRPLGDVGGERNAESNHRETACWVMVGRCHKTIKSVPLLDTAPPQTCRYQELLSQSWLPLDFIKPQIGRIRVFIINNSLLLLTETYNHRTGLSLEDREQLANMIHHLTFLKAWPQPQQCTPVSYVNTTHIYTPHLSSGCRTIIRYVLHGDRVLFWQSPST